MFPTDFSFIAKNCFHFCVLLMIFCRFSGSGGVPPRFFGAEGKKKGVCGVFAAEKEKTKKIIFFWFSSCAGGFYMI